MDTRITSYLPRVLLEWYSSHPSGEAHRRSHHTGVLLFADTSGFTTLTRSLGAEGEIGFETLTGLLNSLFRSLERVIASHRGDILKFSGDAVWCFFPSDTPVDAVYAGMLHEIERLNSQQRICRDHPLSLHAGAARGSFTIVTFGDEQTRLEYEIVGEIVQSAYQACDTARAGELVLISPSGEETRLSPRASSAHQVAPPDLRSGLDPDPFTALSISRASFAAIEKYLPAIVRRRKLEGDFGKELQSEHRQVATMFINMVLASEDTSESEVGAGVCEIFRIIESNGGIVARVDPFTRGHKLLALFGAPVKSSSDNLNALHAADIIAHLGNERTAVKIGLAVGPLFCGEVGSTGRKEYTVMGEAVNLAARLMSQASDSEILIDRTLYEGVCPLTMATPMKVKLKGIGDAIAIYRFDSWRQTEAKLPSVSKLFGREEILGRLALLWTTRPPDRLQWLALGGEVGVGRTSLACALARGHAPNSAIYLSGYGSNLRHAGWLIAEWLIQLYSPRTDSRFSHRDAIDKLTERIDEKWLPIMHELLGVATSDNEWTRELSSELRFDKLADIVGSLITGSSRDQMVILDDLEAADSLTKAVLKRLMADSPKTSGLAILIDTTLGWLSDGIDCTAITLERLGESALKEWGQELFAPGAREKELSEILISRSEGNPLFLKDAIEQLAVTGAIGHLTDERRWEVLRPIESIQLTERLEELQLAEFDRLPESHRCILKIAAVVEGKFTPLQLKELTGIQDISSIEAILKEVTKRGLLSFDPATLIFAFRHSFTREAIYNCMTRSDLGRLHRKVAEMLLNEGCAEGLFRVASHYSRSDDTGLAFAYSLKAACLAKSKGLPVEAGQFFRKCDRILGSAQMDEVDREPKLEFYREAADSATLEGNYGDAYRFLRGWRRLARSLDLPPVYHASANEFARLLWKQSKYPRCRQVLHRLTKASKSVASPSLLADTYSLWGELCRRTGKLSEAKSACLEAVQLSLKSADCTVQSTAFNNLGLACWSAGELAEARDHFLQSLNARRTNRSKYAEARVANNLAIIADEMGDYVEARRLAEEARGIFMEIGDRRNQAYASGNLANLLVYSGRYREAIELYQAADAIFVKLGETHPHCYTIGNLGDIDLLLGSLDEAFAKYAEVWRFARESGDQELEAETAVRFAEHAYYGGHLQQAKELYEDAIRRAEAVGSKEYEIRGTIGLCRLLIGERNTVEARQNINRLVAFAEATGSDRTRYEAEFLTGELLRICGEAAASRDHYQRCIDYACRQQQFELRLKSCSRVYESQTALRDEAAGRVRSLLEEFGAANGDLMLGKLMTSKYFQFFEATLNEVLTAQPVPLPQ